MITAKPLRLKALQASSDPENPSEPVTMAANDRQTDTEFRVIASRNQKSKIKEPSPKIPKRSFQYLERKQVKFFIESLVNDSHGITVRNAGYVLNQFCQKMNCFASEDVYGMVGTLLRELNDEGKITRVKLSKSGSGVYLYFRRY